MPSKAALLRHLGALLISALGVLGVIGLSLGMNATVQKRRPEVATLVEGMSAAPERKPAASARKQRSTIARKAARAAPSPAAALASGLAGLDFGLSGGAEGLVGGATSALINQVGAEVMSEDEVQDPPRPAAITPPSFPARARQSGTTGQVTVSFIVDVDGSVADAHVVDAKPPGFFEEAALDAVSSWTFEPGRSQGSPVAVRVAQTLRFELE